MKNIVGCNLIDFNDIFFYNNKFFNKTQAKQNKFKKNVLIITWHYLPLTL